MRGTLPGANLDALRHNGLGAPLLGGVYLTSEFCTPNPIAPGKAWKRGCQCREWQKLGWTLRVTNPVRQRLATRRKRVLRGTHNLDSQGGVLRSVDSEN